MKATRLQQIGMMRWILYNIFSKRFKKMKGPLRQPQKVQEVLDNKYFYEMICKFCIIY